MHAAQSSRHGHDQMKCRVQISFRQAHAHLFGKADVRVLTTEGHVGSIANRLSSRCCQVGAHDIGLATMNMLTRQLSGEDRGEGMGHTGVEFQADQENLCHDEPSRLEALRQEHDNQAEHAQVELLRRTQREW